MNYARVWSIRAGARQEADSIFVSGGQVAMSCGDIEADASQLPPTRGAFKEAFARATGGSGEATPAHAGQLFRFVHEVSIGDRIVYPRRQDRTLRWGEIVGPYVFESDGGEFAHRRAVRWIGKCSRDDISQGLLYEMSSLLTLFEVKSFADELWRKFENDGPGFDDASSATEGDTAIAVARDIADTTRDFISRKIKSELKGYPFEPFVADLFRAMGYRARVTRQVRDNGVDIIAHRDELGIEPPILKVQVKVHEANIGADAVKAFYAMVHDRDVGIFITTGGYSAAATEFASSKGNLRLVNGVEFVDLVQKYYDALDINFRRQIPLRRVFVPDVPDAA